MLCVGQDCWDRSVPFQFLPGTYPVFEEVLSSSLGLKAVLLRLSLHNNDCTIQKCDLIWFFEKVSHTDNNIVKIIPVHTNLQKWLNTLYYACHNISTHLCCSAVSINGMFTSCSHSYFTTPVQVQLYSTIMPWQPSHAHPMWQCHLHCVRKQVGGLRG